MTVNHKSNLQLLPSYLNRHGMGSSLIAVLEQKLDSDGKFMRWDFVPHSIKNQDAAQHMKAECYTIFNQWGSYYGCRNNSC
jgi:hypothetical protein